MLRVRVVGTGWAGSPSFGTCYFTAPTEGQDEAEAVEARVQAFYDAMKALWPAAVVFTTQPQVDVLDPVNGDVTNSFIVSTGAPVVGTDAGVNGSLPPATALLMRLDTSVFNGGRRLRGRIFLSGLAARVPMVAGAPTSTMIGAANAGATSLMAGQAAAFTSLVVWRRPRDAAAGPPPVEQRDGSTGVVTALTVSPKFAVLRSRRD